MKYHLDQEVVTGFISEAKSYLPEIVLGLESFLRRLPVGAGHCQVPVRQ